MKIFHKSEAKARKPLLFWKKRANGYFSYTQETQRRDYRFMFMCIRLLINTKELEEGTSVTIFLH